MIAKKLNKNKGYLATKTEKWYAYYIISMMIEKHLKRGKEIKGNIMVIDRSDGDVHSSTNTKDSGIVPTHSYTLMFYNMC